MAARLFIFFLVLFVGLGLGPALAQLLPDTSTTEQETTLPDPLTPEAVREMVSQLSDAEVRRLLLERLDAVARGEIKPDETGSVAAFLGEQLLGVGTSIGKSIIAIPKILPGLAAGLEGFVEPRGMSGVMVWFGILAAAIVVALGAEAVFGIFCAPIKTKVGSREDRTFGQTMGVLGLRVMMDFGGIVVFLMASGLVIWFAMPVDPPFGRETAWGLAVGLVVFPRIGGALTRFLLAPQRPDLRLVHTDDETASYYYRMMMIIAGIYGFTQFLLPFLEQHGVPKGEIRIGFWLNLAVHALLFYAAWQKREGLRKMLLGPHGDVTRAEAIAANIYPTFCLVLIAANWVFVEMLAGAERFDLLDGRQDVTMMLLLFAPAFDVAIRGLVRHLAPKMKGEGAIAEEAHRATHRAFIRIGRVTALGLLLWITALLWDLEVANMAAAGVGFQVAAGLIHVFAVLVVGYLTWEAVTLWINLKLAAEQTAAGFDLNQEEPGGGEGGGAGGSRLSTILPLMRWALQSVIVVMTVLIALGNIGIDITPLLAGAGIVGIAIGFGAQKLVSDIVSGIFFLIDDAFRTGEYLEIDGTMGTVEKISIRSLQLRHHRGPVHTIPFGEIPKITNYSRDWVIMKLRFTVPFDTDPNKVKKIFKQIGKEMMEVPEFADDFLQPFKSQGVLEIDDVGMVMRGKFMAKPGKQFTLRKEIYIRVKKAFEDNGLQFARKEVRVKLDGPAGTDDLSEENKQAIGAAAVEAEGQAPEKA